MSTHIPAGAVVVGVDGSEHSGIALAWAVQVAQREHRALVIAHGTGRLSPLHPTQDRGAARHERRIPGRRIVDGALRLARAAGPDLDIETIVRVDDPISVLLELAQGAGLVVVGSRGRGPVASALLGSLSVAVSKAPPCPVVVVRSREAVTSTRVLAAVSGTDEDAGVLEFAARHVDPTSGALIVVHGLPTRGRQSGGPADGRAYDVDPTFRDRHPDLRLQVVNPSGALDAYLVGESRSAALIVMGSPGGSPPRVTQRRSRSHHVIESAACSVAVVPVRSDALAPPARAAGL